MLYVRPDFYDDFHCLAAACRHSCCVGWEIDVDEDSLAWNITKASPENWAKSFGGRSRLSRRPTSDSARTSAVPSCARTACAA